MAIFHDFSDISESTLKFSLELYQKSGFLRLDQNELKFIKPSNIDFMKVYCFWQDVGLATEYLLKAVLLKHEVLNIRRNSEVTNLEKKWHGFQIKSDKNPWLATALKNNKITHTKMLDTGTMAKAISQIKNLQKKKVVTSDEVATLVENLGHLRISRRNQSAHTYTKRATLVEYDDLTKIYLPSINLLMQIYYR